MSNVRKVLGRNFHVVSVLKILWVDLWIIDEEDGIFDGYFGVKFVSREVFSGLKSSKRF